MKSRFLRGNGVIRWIREIWEIQQVLTSELHEFRVYQRSMGVRVFSKLSQ